MKKMCFSCIGHITNNTVSMRANTVGASLIMYLQLQLIIAVIIIIIIIICVINLLFFALINCLVYKVASANVLPFLTSRSKPKTFTLQS